MTARISLNLRKTRGHRPRLQQNNMTDSSDKTPRLKGISGPARDTVLRLDRPAVLGRDPGNTVRLDDDTVSRSHTEVYPRHEQVVVRDLGSTNGTFLNGARLMENVERVLAHHDLVKIGNSRFIFLQHEEQVSQASPANRERRTTTIRVGPVEHLVARSDKAVSDAFVAFGNTINRIQDEQKMLARTLEAVFDMIPAGRAAIQLLGGSELYSELTSGSSAGFDINPFIRRQVLDEEIPVQSNDGDSVLCVPIASASSLLGIIYIQHADPAALDGLHLEILSGVAGFLAPALESLLEKEWLKEQARRQAQVQIGGDTMVGESPVMNQVRITIQKVAATDASVLVLGENGTGKELAAAAIHRNSQRRDKPFVVVNCGAIPEELKQSELFGHEKGSFTGATAQRKGKLEIADGGTLFLDEIGELPLNTQVLLLRFLQEREIQRVGSNQIIHSDVRLIAATNRNLEQMVRQGKFREDLYYRLRVVPLRMPALAERRDDIPLLAAYFIRKHAAKMGKPVLGISRDAHPLMMSLPWKGNVRELENAVIGALVFADGDYIRAQDLRRAMEEPLPFERKPDESLDSFLERAERWLIQTTLDEAAGNIAMAARRLNMHQGSLYRRLEKLEIKYDAG